VYGADFIADLNDRQLRFLVLHEVYHKLYRHLTTWQHLYKENAQLANMACDYVINCKLVDDNADLFATMDGKLTIGCHDTKYRGWDSAQVFNDLKKNPPPQGQGGSGQGSGGFDEHGWGDAEEMTAEEQRDLAREIDEAIRQGALAAGKLGNGMDRDMVELLQPQVDWREVLRDFVQTTCQGNDYSTWRRPNRRYIGAGVYMPSGISEQIGEIVVAIDTSGSIGARELGVFLAEIKSVADTVHPEAIRILYWDTSVCGDERYEGAEVDNIIQSTKPKGGGGTDVRCVPDYIADKQIKAQAVIVLTDGYLFGGWGQWHHPVLWCVLDNERAVPDVGKTVHVKARDL
jgi:predicted metal-dependent peptidase